ncbi:sugar ABC transporter permease [Rhodophyticola sp. CCM32]|uniref:ABC transporter permease n=1 Tax=Rhodophyticola sp. CCM32 TaxID=2916397 RepID=UPI00107F966A|nr:ABC transporter permease [Rhodophyticola sp. CCM32]QBY02241.1 sugar ABC transporter permease [Rhodophyticola sp. CCM32]
MAHFPDTSPEQTLRQTRTRRSFATARAIAALMLREMSVTYGRSPGGYLWAVLEPAAGIGLMVLIFSVAFEAPPMGSNFAMFYATGLVPFLAYMDLNLKTGQALNYSRQLLSYPSVTYVDALLARFTLNLLTQILVGYIIFFGILTLSDTNTVPDLGRIAIGYLMMASLAIGVGTMNCFLLSVFPVWQAVWSIMNRPLFIVSCIFFTFESIPEPFQSYLWYNPLVHVVGYIRMGFYSSYDASYVSLTYVFGLSLVLAVAGLVFLRRYHRDILNF